MATKPLTPERRAAIFKDLTQFLCGVAGIGYQQYTGQVNIFLLAVFTMMMGLPGITNLLALFRSPTALELSQSQGQGSLPVSGSSSTGAPSEGNPV